MTSSAPIPITRSRKKRPLVKVILDPGSPRIHAGILRAARELRWELEETQTPGGRDCDGMLSTTATDELWHRARALKSPVIRILGNTVSAASDMPLDAIPTVTMDLAKAGQMAARHLLSLGISNIVFFRNYGIPGASSLCDSFLETCRLAGKSPLVLDATSEKPSDRSAWLLRRISKLPLPCAIMADHDRFAVEAITAAKELGLRVPEDIAVLGTEDLEFVQSRSPVPVSSLDMNLEQLGYTAARLLDRSMRGEVIEPKHCHIPPKRVVERQSTATFCCPVPGISKAILKIRSHYATPISVPALARECGMSIRNFYRLYRATTGNTVGKDIMARRMEAAAEMLGDESLKLEPIAMESGLGNAKNLCRLFKEHYGQTPGQWRASGKALAGR
jgi:LacI family transcriptional regulator